MGNTDFNMDKLKDGIFIICANKQRTLYLVIKDGIKYLHGGVIATSDYRIMTAPVSFELISRDVDYALEGLTLN